MLLLAALTIDNIQPSYGIGFSRHRLTGPELYINGVNYSVGIDDTMLSVNDPSKAAEARRISRWGHTAMPARVWERGLLRDVYPWNFLTAPQLTAPVDGVPLQQWIGQGTDRGTLTPLSNGVVLWDVPEQSLPAVRDALTAARRIYNWPDVV